MKLQTTMTTMQTKFVTDLFSALKTKIKFHVCTFVQEKEDMLFASGNKKMKTNESSKVFYEIFKPQK